MVCKQHFQRSNHGLNCYQIDVERSLFSTSSQNFDYVIMDFNSTINNSTISTNTNVITVPLCAIGILSNTILTAIITTSKRLRNPTYLLIANMGISNTLLCFTVCLIDFQYSTKTLMSTFINNFLCKVIYTTITTCYVVSVFSLTLISLYRLESVVKSNKLQLLSTILKHHKCIILVIWVLGFIICTPIFCIMKYSKNDITCDLYTSCGQIFNVFYYVTLFSMVYVAPAIIMAATFVKIGQNIRMTSDAMIFRTRFIIASNQRVNSAIKFLSIATGFYMLFSWPLLMLTVVVSIMETNLTKLYEASVIAPVLITAAYISSFLVNVFNPFLYLVYDKNIRGRLQTIYRKKFPRIFRAQSP